MFAGLAVAAVVAAAAGCGGEADTSPGKSLAWNGFSGAGLVKPHHRFTWGGTAIYNKDSKPLTLRDVSLVDPTNGLHLLAVNAVPRSRDWTGFHRGIPGWVKREPLDGTIIPPERVRGVGLALEYEAGQGRSRYSGLKLTYELGGDTYTQTVPSKLRVYTKGG